MLEAVKVKQTALPQKKLHGLLNYNEVTGVFTNKVQKGRAKIGQPRGYIDSNGYVVIRINGHLCYAHRLAWVYVHGDYPDGEQPFIDHINGKRADNRFENLRVSSRTENNKNAQMRSSNTSGVNGVRRMGVSNNSKKNPKINYYWVTVWCNENGKSQIKYFSIHKLGENEAKQSAIEYRAEQLRLLELNFGIFYSDRHGV